MTVFDLTATSVSASSIWIELWKWVIRVSPAACTFLKKRLHSILDLWNSPISFILTVQRPTEIDFRDFHFELWTFSRKTINLSIKDTLAEKESLNMTVVCIVISFSLHVWDVKNCIYSPSTTLSLFLSNHFFHENDTYTNCFFHCGLRPNYGERHGAFFRTGWVSVSYCIISLWYKLLYRIIINLIVRQPRFNVSGYKI